MHVMPALTELQPGLQVDQYLLEVRLGSGAIGEVWQATDGVQTAALKFLHPHHLHSADHARYLHALAAEADALEKLAGHAHIPALYGYNLRCARPYIALQMIDSPAFDRLIASGDIMLIPLRARLRTLDIIARTIGDMHQHDIIHRDIKPANIRGIEHPYLMDFSIAVESQRVSLSDTSMGTGLYMPPPDNALPDALTDHYSFALSAYEVIFGQHAIFTPHNTGATVLETRQLAREYLRKKTWRVPSQLSSADLPGNLRGADLRALDGIFQKALGEREKRYRDLSQFMDDLQAAILTMENIAYIDELPTVPVSPQEIAEEADYTIHEVTGSSRATNHKGDGKPRPLSHWLNRLRPGGKRGR
jgi:serine/threonine protein kinase